ncbi:hypothetical protein CRENBAI_003061 [Crenichthys baileyi]|uniref:Transposase Tc1-like domain-containing protein n=1 Tax=Crenichthys baileyi TaxID=28760 RepID=A0AAV9S6E3_9TELE
MSAYHQEGRSTSNRINCGRKRKLSERDVRVLTRIVSKKYETTAAQIMAELNVHLNSPVSTRTVRRELHRVNIHGRAAIAKPLVTHANAKPPMSSAQFQREFIRERLTAAAEEIFTEHSVWKEEDILTGQRLNNQKRNCIFGREEPGPQHMMENHGKGKPAWIKEEKEILESLWRRENQGEPEPLFMKEDQEEPESQIKDEQEEIKPHQVKEEPESLRIKTKQEEIEPLQIKEEWAEPKPPQIKDEQEESGPPEIKVEHEEADPLQIKNEQEVLCMGLEKEQLELKQQTDTSTVNTTFKETTMYSAQSLREFIRERLTAAAEEIFTEVDKTIVYYEEELDRQRRLLEIKLKPPINLQRIDLPKHYLWRERDSLSEQQFNNYERNLSLHQEELQPQQMQETQGEVEPLQMKEEQEELEPQQMQKNQDELEVICVKEELEESELPHIKDEQEELCLNLEKKEDALSKRSPTIVTEGHLCYL